jgi:hypothetical protein
MKQSYHYGLVAILSTALFFSGCKKVRDYVSRNPPMEVKLCNIEKLKLNVFGEKNVLKFSYDELGNPISILHGKPNINSNVDQHFRYDEDNRLKDYLTNYSGNVGVLEWHTYTYINKKTIIDTAYYYEGRITDPHAPYEANDFAVWIYELDVVGRIIKSTFYNQISPEAETIKFSYDEKGNLKKPGISYDDKVNITRTNKIWMFLNKDYSMNNSLGAKDSNNQVKIKSYNSSGLPLQYEAIPHQLSLGRFTNLNFEELEVDYTCSGSHSN